LAALAAKAALGPVLAAQPGDLPQASKAGTPDSLWHLPAAVLNKILGDFRVQRFLTGPV
jgi:hypothetical protein